MPGDGRIADVSSLSAQVKAQRFDIVIGGGSFAGLALARALSMSMGPDCRIAVADPGPLHGADDTDTENTTAPADARASAISAGAKRMLDVLEVWPLIANQAQPVTDIELTDSSLDAAVRPSLLTYDNTVGADEPASYILENVHLREALVSVVSDDDAITLMDRTGIEGFAADENHVSTTLGNGRRLTASLLIAADGRASRLRQAAGIKIISWRHRQIGIVTTVGHEKPHFGRAVQHFLPAGPFAILPLKGDRACITWTEDETRGRQIMALDDDGFLAEVQKRFGHKLGQVTADGPRACWPLETHLARSFIAPRFALIGDAAHGVHPIAGQGLNLGLRDVAALAELLTGSARLGIDLGGAMALERYERWRRFDSALSAAAFSGLNQLFSNDWTLARTARDAGLGIVDRLPGLKRFFVNEAAGLTGEIPRLLKGEKI